MRRMLALAFLALAACTDPELGVGVTAGTGGVTVSPVVSGNVGNATITVSR